MIKAFFITMENETQVQESLNQAEMGEGVEIIGDAVSPEKRGKFGKYFGWARKIKIKWAIIAAIVIIVAGLLYYYKSFFVVASVDGKLVSRFSVIKRTETMYGQQALDYLITEKLIQVGLNESDVTVSDEEVSDEINKLTASIVSQGGTLAEALAQNKMTEDDLRDKIITQKKLEKILADKISVSAEEVDQYVKDNKITFSKDTSVEEQKAEIAESLKNQKFNTEADAWIENIRAEANIKYYLEYK